MSERAKYHDLKCRKLVAMQKHNDLRRAFRQGGATQAEIEAAEKEVNSFIEAIKKVDFRLDDSQNNFISF